MHELGSKVALVRGRAELCPRRRRLLLLGTALGSTLMALSSQSFAASCTQPASPAPIIVGVVSTPISCTNTAARTATAAGDNAIGVTTTGNGNTVDITNSGTLTTDSGSLVAPPPGGSFSQSTGARGIYAGTNGIGANITIKNTGDINSYSDSIKATDAATSGTVLSSDTHITITNSGNLTAGPNAEGIFGRASYGSGNVVTISNSGSIETGYSASTSGTSSGIVGNVGGDNGLVDITNSGAITTSGLSAAGISAVASYYNGSNSSIVINNKAGGTITTTNGAYGIFAQAGSIGPANPDNGGTIKLTNAATISAGYIGIGAFTYGSGGDITISNKASITSGTGGGDGSDGIKAVSNGGDTTISVTNSGAIDTTNGGANSVGIEAINGGLFSGSDLHISVTNTGDITTGADSEGIFARSAGAGGMVTVDNSGNIVTGASTSTSGGSTGIFADVSGDNSQISVTNNGTIHTVGYSAAGISAIANYYSGQGDHGSIVINNKAGGTITTEGAGAYGIFAQAGSVGKENPDNGGTVQITNAATIHSGYMGIAGFTYGSGGNVTIDNKGAITSGTGGLAGSDGIKALANMGDSTITITNSGDIDTTDGGNKSVGIEAINGPSFTGTNLVISVTNSGNITTAAESVGIKAASYGANASVTVDNSGSIRTGSSTTDSGGSTGIFADVTGDNGQVSVTNSGAIATSGKSAAGISAIANYYGVSNGTIIVPTNNGSVVVNNKAGGTITTTGSDALGIFAQAGSKEPHGQDPNADNGGTVDVTNAAAINSGSHGIGAYTYGTDGTVTVTNSGRIFSTNGEGIYAKSNGHSSNITISNSASVDSGSSFGVIAEAVGNASTVVINTSADIYGKTGGVQVNSTGGSTVNVKSGGYVGAENYLAITSTAGTAEINVYGTVAGRVVLSNAGNVMNINDKGLFRAKTDSNFGTGVNTLNNAGTINASGSYFGSSPNTVSFIGLTSFVNGSTGSGAGLTTMIDGVVGDSLTTSGNFTGQGNSRLGVDVNFATSAADTLTIGGNSYGRTNLAVNVTAIPVGVPSTSTFIPVVTVDGTTNANNFGVAAPVNAGLFAYDLFLQGHEFGLRTVGLGNAAFELPGGMTGAQNVWQDTTDFWQDRMADLRTETSGAHNADIVVSTPTPRMGGLWARAAGDWSDQDGSVTYVDPVSQNPETLDLHRRQNTGAFLGGVDMGIEGVAGGDVIFGLMAGYVTSTLDFTATGDSWKYKGGTVGAYATYLNGGFYLDGLLKADFLSIDISDQGGVPGSASTNATNIGVRLDTGYRFATAWGFVEPQASLEWVHTQMDSLSLFGGDVSFDNGSSGRARIGVRVGKDMQMNGMTVTPDLTLSVWNHFGSSNSVGINFPGNAFSATDSTGNGTFGEVGAGVSVVSANNWSGIVRGSYRFGDGSNAGSLGATVRYNW
ncbi:beta strand repeat-containing protein [Mesorhizobium sp.]|uniref:beta strand repeat-containing protein n=1 Tax=Mesorhizobium sp. TaxID=1871066 RepID=UPI003BAD5E6F